MRTIIASTLFVGCVAGMQPARFSFGGLDLGMSVKDLRSRYPQSEIVDDGLVYVSEKDSHDHISTIQLSGGRPARILHIAFERRGRDGAPSYPQCANVLSALQQRYGRPASVIDAREERARNRRFDWKAPAETLTLRCFRMPREPLYAESITMESGV